MKTLVAYDPIESYMTLNKEGDGNNAIHVVSFRPVSYNNPIEFTIRGEWEFEAFKSLISKL